MRKSNFIFITGGDEGYLPIVEVCVKSLLEFSKHHIIVYGFNCDVPYDYPNMTKRRIDIKRNKKFSDRDTRLYYNKIDASIDCLDKDDSKVYIWLDGDCVVNKNIDSIIKHHIKLEHYPLCMRYMHKKLYHRKYPFGIKGDFIEKTHGEELGMLLGQQQNNRFTVATGLYMFDIRSNWFFEMVLNQHEYLLRNIDASNFIDDMALSEERLFNVLFWKYKLKNTLPITWYSKDHFLFEKEINVIPKYVEVIKSGFDIMFDFDGGDPRDYEIFDQSSVLFYHGQNNIKKANKLLNKLKPNKLMVVAHPDDETIFGGNQLLNGFGWVVVLVTSGDGDGNNPRTRLKEFERVLSKLNVNDFHLLHYKDDMHNIYYDESDVKKDLLEIINKQKWEKIVTHNEDGEYGHVIHKSVHNILVDIKPDNLYVFKPSGKHLDSKTLKQKIKLLSLYASQNTNLDSFKEYITNESIKKYGRK